MDQLPGYHVMKPHHPQKSLARQEALNTAYKLFQQASSSVKTSPALANRYVALARKLAMKYNLRLPPELQQRFCKHCYAFLLPGSTSRVRVAKQRVIVACFACKKYMRYPLHAKKKVLPRTARQSLSPKHQPIKTTPK